MYLALKLALNEPGFIFETVVSFVVETVVWFQLYKDLMFLKLKATLPALK